MAASFPSSTNVFIPTSSTNIEVTANLVVNFSRNPSRFPLNQYIKLIPVKYKVGYYKRMSVGAQARIQKSGLENFLFNPGQGKPRGNWNKQGFTNVQYTTERYSYTTELDLQTEDQADFQLQALDVAMLAQQAMTGRTLKLLNKVTTTALWGSNTNNATSLVGGQWSAATATNPYVMNSLQTMAITVNEATLGAVNLRDMSIVINPYTAAATARSQEWRSFLANQVGGIKFLEGDAPTPASLWNLAPHLYGVKLVIEDCVYNNAVTTAADNTSGSSYALPNGACLFVSRPGDMPASEGATDFATLGIFSLEEMTTESKTDQWDRLLHLSVTDEFYPDIITPIAGYYLTGCA